jgi:hypothetical protein
VTEETTPLESLYGLTGRLNASKYSRDMEQEIQEELMVWKSANEPVPEESMLDGGEASLWNEYDFWG